MKSTAERKKQEPEQGQQNGGLRSIPIKEKKRKKSLFSMFFSSAEKQKALLFHIDDGASLEEALELIRFASSLRGDHRRMLLAPPAMHPFFTSSQLFTEMHPLTPAASEKALSQAVRGTGADLFISSRSASIRGVTSVQLKSRNRSYHRFPSFWKALPMWNGKGKSKGNKKGKKQSHLEKADLQLSQHNLRFRITMRRMFEALAPSTHPIWIPVSLDPFTGSPWPFSSYMRLCRMLSQNGMPFVVTLDEKSARESNDKDREVLRGLPVFRKELALLSRGFDGIRLIESPSFDEQLSLARFSKIVIGNPSPELLLAQMGGSQIVFLHDMLTYRSLHAGRAEELTLHASHDRSLFDESVQLIGGLSLKPHVDECVRDCPACSHNYCVDTISAEAVFEELKLLLAQGS